MATEVKPGDLRKMRRANRMSPASVSRKKPGRSSRTFSLAFPGRTEGDTGAALGFLARESGALEILGLTGDVRANFLLEFADGPGAMKDGREQLAEIGKQLHGSLRGIHRPDPGRGRSPVRVRRAAPRRR